MCTMNKPIRKARAFTLIFLALAALMLSASMGCVSRQPPAQTLQAEHLTKVAQFERDRPSGVAVSPSNRVFVCFPYFTTQPELALAEVTDAGRARAFPNQQWNHWDGQSGRSARTRFVCVKDVWADENNSLWVLDAGNPRLMGVVHGAAKLVQIDLTLNRVTRVISFDERVAPNDSYLNGLSVDPATRTAYITDSGAGALVVVDLVSGHARRLLAEHASVKGEKGVVPVAEGIVFKFLGRAIEVHSDAIAISPERDWLYYHAMTGRHLYRVPTTLLRDPYASADELAASVEDLGETPLPAGMLMDPQGNLYLAAVEENAVIVRRPDGSMETIVQSPLLSWPDALARSPDGHLYITSSMIHLLPHFKTRPPADQPFGLYRIPLY